MKEVLSTASQIPTQRTAEPTTWKRKVALQEVKKWEGGNVRYETNKSQPPFPSLTLPLSGFEIRRFIFRARDDGSGGAQIGRLATRGPGNCQFLLRNVLWMGSLMTLKDGDTNRATLPLLKSCILRINKPVTDFLRGPFFSYRTQVRIGYLTTVGVECVCCKKDI